MRLLFLFLLIPFFSFSCDCPILSKIDTEGLKAYDVVFYGKVDSVGKCTTEGINKVYFTIEELYKGEEGKNVKVWFDCKTDCLMSFEKGEKWLVYCIYQRFDFLVVNFCEHSRKYFGEGAQDPNSILSQQTFEEEKKFLINTLGIQSFVKKNKLNNDQAVLKPHNVQPSGLNKILLIGISLVVMFIVFFVAKRKRKNGKKV